MRGAWGPGADHCPLLPAPPPQIAKRQAVVNPENTFASVKRFIGRKMNEVGDESTQVPYRVVEDAAGNVKLACPNAGKEFAAEEVSAAVLRKLVDDASKFLNAPVTRAVVTVSAHHPDPHPITPDPQNPSPSP